MDRQSIKNILKEQTEPMSQAVAKKLAYLQSDDVFTSDVERGMQAKEDDSLLAAFGETIQPANVPTYKQPSLENKPANATITTPQPRYVSQSPTEQTIAEHKQNIAARIAALRGISSPGDYLRRK